MNSKITLPALAAALSAKTGVNKRHCEEFLKQFFAVCASALAEGENVKIKGFGTFKIIGVEDRKSVDVSTGEEIVIPGHNKVAFVPSREFADKINTPFSMFESVELADGFDADSEPDLEADSEPDMEQDINHIHEYDSKSIEENDVETADISEPEDEIYVIAADETSNTNAEPMAEENSEEINEGISEENAAESEEEDEAVIDSMLSERKARRRYGIGRFFAGIACGLIIAAVAGFVTYLFIGEEFAKAPTKKTVKVTEKIVAADTIKSKVNQKSNEPIQESYPETEPSDKEKTVYDTIGDRRYLTTMAKDHYGNYNLWPYIYEENKSFLGHPDRIKPGTQVVIPPLSKYGVDPKNPADIAKAKKMGIEIYSRY